MVDIKRYNGYEEFDKLLKMLPIVPSNTEIVEKTGVSKGSVSQIMLGKRTPTKSFIDKFKKGFNLTDLPETKKLPQNESSFLQNHYDKLLKHYIDLADRLERELDFERSKNK